MSVWIQNLKTRLEDRSVIILHGNVRDRYIDEVGRVYENLTALLRNIASEMPITFSELVFYDPIGNEKREPTGEMLPPPPIVGDRVDEDEELAGTKNDEQQNEQKLKTRLRPTQVLEQWNRKLTRTDQNLFVVLFYLDKLVAYKSSYQEDEKEILLRLEKVIENVSPNHRLVLVALQDTMVPIEIYTNSPKTVVLPIPNPEKTDRSSYLKCRLGKELPHLGLIADLTEGLFLRDLDNIVMAASDWVDLGTRDVRRLVNKYRIGEQEDRWGTLNIDRLDTAQRWFVESGGVKGQDEAIQKVVDTLCIARSGLSGVASGAVSKPKGVLFFAGPTGVGKTFTAKKLAEFLFGTEEAFLRFDMSEFKEEHTISKLIGSRPGYVGFERGGMLTNAVRERPFSVILFDEVEKAHPKIMDTFLQILDEGRLTDSRGQTVFFTETVIIFTSNLGTRTTDSRGLAATERITLDEIIDDENISYSEKKERVREHFSKAVEDFFMFEISRPELLNRIGNNIVPFNYIHTPEVQMEIVSSHLRRIKEDFQDRHRSSGHDLDFDDRFSSWLVQKHGERINIFGGRGITNAIDDEVMGPLARAVLKAEHEGQEQVKFRIRITKGQQIIVEG